MSARQGRCTPVMQNNIPRQTMKQIPNELFFAWIEAEISEGHSVQLRLKGDSMYPLLRNGRDQVVLFPCNPDELRPMDVILFRYNGKHFLHRILHIEGNRLYIQGDGSLVAKEECSKEDVIGKVHTIIRPSGKRISVKSLWWRIPSCLWRATGIFRKYILRFLHHFIVQHPKKVHQ